MARAKSHHYVPQVYLRHWAHDGRVAVRRRDRPDPFVTACLPMSLKRDSPLLKASCRTPLPQYVDSRSRGEALRSDYYWLVS